MKVVMAVGVALIFCAGVAWSAEQDQSKDTVARRQQTQEQLQDGSCITDATANDVETPVQTRDRLKDGPCDGEPDTERDQLREQLKDGSCRD
jgi:hypothetical protein